MLIMLDLHEWLCLLILLSNMILHIGQVTMLVFNKVVLSLTVLKKMKYVATAEAVECYSVDV